MISTKPSFANRPNEKEKGYKKQVTIKENKQVLSPITLREDNIDAKLESVSESKVEKGENSPVIQLNQLSGSCLYVNAEINSNPCKLLVDTGSPVCVISTDIFASLKVDQTELQSTNAILQTADGTQLCVKGKIKAKIKMGKAKFEQEVIVANIDELAGILGMDFLEKHDVELKIGKKVLKIKGQNIQLEKTKSNKCARVKVTNDIIIPAQSEILIESEIEGLPK